MKIDKVSKKKQNIITIKGKRILSSKKNKKDDNEDNKKKKFFSEHNSSYFTDNSTPFYLRIIIPNEKCIIGDLFKEIDYENEGLYRFIYNFISDEESKEYCDD